MFKVAVVGTGLIAKQKHLPAWRKASAQAKVTAICDVDPARGEEAARTYGVPKAYSNLDEMLEREKPDIVDICTPPATHVSVTVSSLRAGAHVLVEKPMAMSVAECDQMIAAAKQADRSICVGHSDLFYPSFREARRLVHDGAIGQLYGLRILLSTPVSYMTANPEHWANRLPGGVIGETGPHVVYMTLAFLNPIRKVFVHGGKLVSAYPWSPFDDYRIEFVGDRAISSVTLTYATRQWAGQVDFWGEDGLLRADLQSQTVVRSKRTQLTPWTVATSALSESAQIVGSVAATGLRVLTKRYRTTHDLLIGDFVQSLIDGTPPPVPAEEGRESIRVMRILSDELEGNSGEAPRDAAVAS